MLHKTFDCNASTSLYGFVRNFPVNELSSRCNLLVNLLIIIAFSFYLASQELSIERTFQQVKLSSKPSYNYCFHTISTTWSSFNTNVLNTQKHIYTNISTLYLRQVVHQFPSDVVCRQFILEALTDQMAFHCFMMVLYGSRSILQCV